MIQIKVLSCHYKNFFFCVAKNHPEEQFISPSLWVLSSVTFFRNFSCCFIRKVSNIMSLHYVKVPYIILFNNKEVSFFILILYSDSMKLYERVWALYDKIIFNYSMTKKSCCFLSTNTLFRSTVTYYIM